jgi:hypothetical protein
MYGIIDITDTGFNIKLIRITNIKASGNVFTQNSFATSEMGLQSLTTSDTKYYGTWSDAINNLVTVS